jgi:diguanylate cyclase (GGDEF)-like protein
MASLTMPGATELTTEPSLEQARKAVASKSPIHTSANRGKAGTTGDQVDVAYVPLLTASGPIGALSLVAGREGKFARRHLDFLMSLCSEAAIAIENAQLRAELRRLAVTDYLTGLANRRELERRLSVELERAARYGHSLSVMMLDVDDLKEVNDEYGHATGDEVLRALATLVKQSMRMSEIAGRLGGDEFAVVLPETDAHRARALAERLIERLPQALREWPAIGEAVKTVGAIGLSAGIADDEGGAVSAKDLLGNADAALYEAKRLGKNQAIVASPRGLPETRETAASSQTAPASSRKP